MKFSDLKSAGLITDTEIGRFEADLRERTDYLAVETPGNPSFYWGNYLIFPRAPRAEDEAKWEEIFVREFGHNPEIRHRAFVWDEQKPGFVFKDCIQEESPIFTLDSSRLKKPARFNPEITVRPLFSDADWEQATEQAVHSRPDGFEEERYRSFKVAQMARYRRMARAGHGDWFGAFERGKIVGDCGLYIFSSKGRFQSVVTYADHRRKGVSATLIYHVAEAGLKKSAELVIVADPTMGADRVYASVGFSGSAIQYQQMRRAAHDQN